MDLAVVNQAPSRISVPELLQQLQVTQAELENIRVSIPPTQLLPIVTVWRAHTHL